MNDNKWISIDNPPQVISGKFIGINLGLEHPIPVIVGYHSKYKPSWTNFYTEEEEFITHYIPYPM